MGRSLRSVVARAQGRRSRCSALGLLLLLSAAIPAPAQTPARITWPRDLYNPRPRPDDVLLPLPCGGAMAFRPVPAPGTPPAEAEPDLVALYRQTGPFTLDGQRVMLLGKYEVARQQWATLAAFTGGPCPAPAPDGRLVQGGLGWNDAQAFAARWTRWLADHTESLPDCARAATLCIPRAEGQRVLIRLPSEAEWEYAARSGQALTPAQFAEPRYPMDGGLERHAWYSANSDRQLHPIGQRAANPLGLHDLYGNVEELTRDLYASGR